MSPLRERWFEQWSLHQEACENLKRSLDEKTFQATLERGKAMEIIAATEEIIDELSRE